MANRADIGLSIMEIAERCDTTSNVMNGLILNIDQSCIAVEHMRANAKPIFQMNFGTRIHYFIWQNVCPWMHDRRKFNKCHRNDFHIENFLTYFSTEELPYKMCRKISTMQWTTAMLR